MGKTAEFDLPISPDYGRSFLRDEIKELGVQRIADLAGVDRTTIFRNINKGNLTFTTATKLAEAIKKAHAEDETPLPAIPPPLMQVANAVQYRLCMLGELLALHPGAAEEVLQYALEKLKTAERNVLFDSANERIKNPK